MILIDRLVIASCYLFLFSFPLGLVESFKIIDIIHLAVFLKALGITFVMCFLMIISFYLVERMARLFLKFRDLATCIQTRNLMILQVKTKLYEVAYPFNLKHAFFHFLIIIIYILSIRNGIAYCMISEEDISKIDSVIESIEKAKEIIRSSPSEEDIALIKQAQDLFLRMFKQETNILYGELSISLEGKGKSPRQEEAIYNMVDNLFKCINSHLSYADDDMRSSVKNNKGIIINGQHKGKFFMEVFGENNQYWLIAKKKNFYHELCLKYAVIREKSFIVKDLDILKEKSNTCRDIAIDFPNFMEKIKEKVVSIKQLMIEEKNQKIESPKELVIDDKITQTSTITDYSGDNQEINKLQNKIKELNGILDNKNKIIDHLVAQSEPNQTINQISNKTAPMNTEDLNIESLKDKIKKLNAIIENKTKIIDDLCLKGDSSKIIENKDLQIEELNKKLNNARHAHDMLQNQLNQLDREVGQEMKSLNNELKDKNDEVKRLNNHLDEKNREIKKIKQQLAQKNLGIRWLKIQVEKNNLINQGHYQFMAMGAMGMGIAVTGSYLLSKCI